MPLRDALLSSELGDLALASWVAGVVMIVSYSMGWTVPGLVDSWGKS